MILPSLTLNLDIDVVEAAPRKAEAVINLLERKVVMNSGLLLESTDSHKQSVRKVAACLADAVGLSIDFAAIAA